MAIIPAFGQVMNSPFSRYEGRDKSVSIKFDNDTYYLTDYYYTQGLEIELILPVFSRSFLSPIFPNVPKNPVLVAGISAAQRLYTPKNIRDTLVQFNDRPFAATLELGYFLVSLDAFSGLEMSGRLRIGIIGPAAGGEQLQRKIHDWIESPDPKGWNYQIANDIILNYDFIVNYPLAYKTSYKFGFTGGIRGGTLFDDLGLGLNFTFKKNQFKLQDAENAKSGKTNKRPKFFFNTDAFLKLVLYNATLQGGIFSANDPYVLSFGEISHLVFSANATVGLLWQGIALSYGHNFLTREFKTGSVHNYGSVVLTVNF